MRRFLSSALILAALCASGAARAQHAGDDWIVVGWLHGAGMDSRTSVHTDLRMGNPLLGIPPSFDTGGLSARPRAIDALVLASGHYFTDHFGVELDGGIPPHIALDGSGVAIPPGVSGALLRVNVGDPAYQPLATARQWSPVLALHWVWGDPAQALRPFVAAGFTYTWFTHTWLNPAFVDALNRNFGAPLALSQGHPGPTSIEASVAPLWAPVAKLGLSYALDAHWGLLAVGTYIPYSTTAINTLHAADGAVLATTRVRIRVDALGTVLALRYAL